MTSEEGSLREEVTLSARSSSYIFDLSKHGSKLDGEKVANKLRFFDSSVKDELCLTTNWCFCRFANHSDTHPNMEAQNRYVGGLNRVAFYATTNIPIGMCISHSCAFQLF